MITRNVSFKAQLWPYWKLACFHTLVIVILIVHSFHYLLEPEANSYTTFSNYIKLCRTVCVFFLPLYFLSVPYSSLFYFDAGDQAHASRRIDKWFTTELYLQPTNFIFKKQLWLRTLTFKPALTDCISLGYVICLCVSAFLFIKWD